ncbi:hypothetical protein GYMLUDRAFT_74782 [Collybiopsis luxurians FD-317 M1]|uniref:Unplaced genomic scaffold GYMLUscaffold_35, whole genome shotgun sequence n=1 Tax=Collybiopsis luxurians FD-317 M1 TaxID=944289 RepID=A0A0D0BTJ8_9AGAR|nr:hypothetical protein GYMLUDRAFT_74782 [Collybiopsis luxurians FD-317 M1]
MDIFESLRLSFFGTAPSPEQQDDCSSSSDASPLNFEHGDASTADTGFCVVA